MRYSRIALFMCVLLTLITGIAVAQDSANITVKAIVKDNNGTPIIGANIIDKVNKKRATTNKSGSFIIETKPESILAINAFGYAIKTVMASTGLNEIVLIPESKLIPLAFNNVAAADIPSGVSNVDFAKMFENNYGTFGFENLEGFAEGFNGNGIWGMNQSLVLIDGVPRDITDIMPTEIDQVTFLKSAAAVALYGSRGANGVILVTTKTGSENGQSISIRSNAGLHAPKRYAGYLGSSEYRTLYNEARVNDGLTKLYTDENIYNHSGIDPIRYPSVDFYSSDYLKSGYSRYDVTTEISGGNDKARYYTNIGFNSTGSLLDFGEAAKNNTADRFNIRGNVNMKLNEILKARINASAAFYTSKGVNTDYWSGAATVRPDRFTPLIPISMIDPTDENSLNLVNSSQNIIDGKYVLGGRTLDQTNPIAAVYAGGTNNFNARQFQFTTGVGADLKGITKGLTFDSNLGIDYSSSYNQGYRNGYSTFEPIWTSFSGTSTIAGLNRLGLDTKTGNEVIADSYYRQTLSLSGQFNYNRTFSEKHNVTGILMGGGFAQSVSQVYQKVTNANTGISLGYNYNRKYFAELTGSRVNTPRLFGKNQNEFSTAGSLGWAIGEESFLKDLSFLDNLRITASAGILYTDLNINDYFLYESIYTQAAGTFYAWNDGVLVRTTDSRRGENLDLKMSRREEITLGLQGSIFKNTLSFGGNFFRTMMTGIPIQANVLFPNYFTTGFPNSSFIPFVNYNNDLRTGFDLNIRFNKRIGQVNWSAGSFTTFQSSKASKRAEIAANQSLLREGRPLDGIWGLKSDGFYNTAAEADAANAGNGVPKPAFGNVRPGDIKYIDINNDGLINNQDEVYLGRGGFSGAPLTTGLNLSANWKNFTFFALATARFGANSIKGFGNAAQSNYFWVNGEEKYSVETRNRWTPETANTATFPRLTTLNGDNNNRSSDFWMYSTDRFDLSKVQITYRLTNNVMKSKVFNGLDFYLTGFNLLTVSQERELLELNLGGAPQTRLYNLGVKASF